MLLGETIGVAIGALRANKLRSFLTMLGVVIGVGAVIAVVALGRGASQSVQARISALGTTLLSVSPGQILRIGGFLFEVVGVLASKGNSGGFGNPDDQVLVPITTAQFRLFGNDRLRQIGVLAASEAEIPNAMAEIQRVLRREHRLRVGIPDDFQIRSQADFLNTLGETTQIFTFLLSGIAAVSLLVGGIGIMNIMLVSVTERTREIGVRKALGATPKNILLQFLIEAVVLCLLGGVGGIVFGWLGAVALAKFGNFNTSVAPSSILLAFFFSGFVGILFGVWPARRAANLDPIQSLRYE